MRSQISRLPILQYKESSQRCSGGPLRDLLRDPIRFPKTSQNLSELLPLFLLPLCPSPIARLSCYIPPGPPKLGRCKILCWKHAASIAAQATVSFLSRYGGYRSSTVANRGLKCHYAHEALFLERFPPDGERISTPTLNNSLVRIFCLQPGLAWKFLLREPGRGKSCCHCNFQNFHFLSKASRVSLVRTHFSHPESDGKSSDVGVGGRIGILIFLKSHRVGSRIATNSAEQQFIGESREEE